MLLFLIALSPGLLADEASSGTPPKTSARLTQEIRAGLPKFTPPAPTPAPASPPADEAAPPRDPDVVVLPKITVREKRPPTNDPDLWLNGRAVQQKAMAAYHDSMTPLEWALNSWYIPLFGAPPSVRAREYYADRKLADEADRLNSVIKAVGLTDPGEAAKLRNALDLGKLPKEGQ